MTLDPRLRIHSHTEIIFAGLPLKSLQESFTLNDDHWNHSTKSSWAEPIKGVKPQRDSLSDNVSLNCTHKNTVL